MHNYGNHKAYLAVLLSVSLDFSDGCSLLQLGEVSFAVQVLL